MYFFMKIRLFFLQKSGHFLAEVRPNGSAEPSVKLAEPFGFGRTTFSAVRSFTNIHFLMQKKHAIRHKYPNGYPFKSTTEYHVFHHM